jgi:hypothetical protein
VSLAVTSGVSVWVGGMGASLDGSDGALTDDRNWANISQSPRSSIAAAEPPHGWATRRTGTDTHCAAGGEPVV